MKYYSPSNDGEMFGEYGDDGKFYPCGYNLTVTKVEKSLEDDTVFISVEFNINQESQCIRCTYNDLNTKLANVGYAMPNGNITAVQNYLQQQEFDTTVSYIHGGIGWMMYKGIHLFRGQVALGFNSTYSGQFDIAVHGKLEEFISDYTGLIRGDIQLQTAVVIGLTSCLIGYLSTIPDSIEVPTLIFDINGRSTTGKTTCSNLAVSMGGTPKKRNEIKSLSDTCSTTVNALYTKLNDNYGYTILFDETRRLGTKADIAGLIYSVSEGTDKSRMCGNNQVKPPNHWATVVIFTGESELTPSNERADGLMVRVVSFNNVQWTKSANQAAQVRAFSEKYAGLPIMALAHYLRKKPPDEIVAMYNDEVSSLTSKIPLQPCYQERMAKAVAALSVTAKLAKDALNIDLDVNGILKFVLEQVGGNSRECEAESAFYYVLNMYHQNASMFGDEPIPVADGSRAIRGTQRSTWGFMKYQYFYNQVRGKRKSRMKSSKSIGACELVITKDIFEGWMRTGGYVNVRNILQEWKNKGILKRQKSDHNYCERKLFTGGSNTKCICLLINNGVYGVELDDIMSEESKPEKEKDPIALKAIKSKIYEIFEKTLQSNETQNKLYSIADIEQEFLDNELDPMVLAKIIKDCVKIDVDIDRMMCVYDNNEMLDENELPSFKNCKEIIDDYRYSQEMINKILGEENDE